MLSYAYIMSKEMYEGIASDGNKIKNPVNWYSKEEIIKYVNKTFGLLRPVTEIKIES